MRKNLRLALNAVGAGRFGTSGLFPSQTNHRR
jgi:hypothetical protein